jgi:hypothetical protein
MNFNNLLVVNFNNLAGEGYASLTLSLIFTIITLASAIFLLKHKGTTKAVTILATLVFPAITVFCWLYLILLVNNFELIYALLYSLAGAVDYLILAMIVGSIGVQIAKSKEKRLANQAQTEEPVEAEHVEVSEVVEEKTEQQPMTLLIDHTAEEKSQEETQEEVPQEEVAVEEAQEEAAVEEAAPVEEATTQEETAESPVEEQTDDGDEAVEGGVVFAQESKESFAEQLAKCSAEINSFYNEILEYAKTKDISMVKESRSHVIVKMGRMRLVEFKFNRGKLVSRFMAGSSELKNYSMTERSVKIKEKPVIIEIESEYSVGVAKNMIDIVCKNITDAREAKANAAVEEESGEEE